MTTLLVLVPTPIPLDVPTLLSSTYLFNSNTNTQNTYKKLLTGLSLDDLRVIYEIAFTFG